MGDKIRPALIGGRDLAQTIGKERQRALGRDLGIELAHRACRRIAWVGKSLATGSQLAFVELFQIGTHHVHLAAHFHHGRHLRTCGQRQRNLANGADIVGDVLAHLAITTRGGLHQQAVFIAQIHGQTVELGLGYIFDGGCRCVQAQLLAHALVESDGASGFVVGLGLDAEHGHGVAHRRQAIKHRANHTLGGRVGRHQFRVGTLQRFQLLIQAVVLPVGHAGGIEHIVFMRPLMQLGTQGCGLGGHALWQAGFDSSLRFIVLGFSGKKV